MRDNNSCHGCRHLEEIFSKIGEIHEFKCHHFDKNLTNPPTQLEIYCYDPSYNEQPLQQQEVPSGDDDLVDGFHIVDDW